MKKKIIGLVFCMLLIIPVLSLSCPAKDTVLISGRHLKGGSNGAHDFWLGKIFDWRFIKPGQSGNYLILNFNKPVLLIVNNIPQVIKKEISIKIVLTEPDEFAVMKQFFTKSTQPNGGVRVFTICDSIEVEPIN